MTEIPPIAPLKNQLGSAWHFSDDHCKPNRPTSGRERVKHYPDIKITSDFLVTDTPKEFVLKINALMPLSGAKGDWDFWISDLVKNPDGTDI